MVATVAVMPVLVRPVGFVRHQRIPAVRSFPHCR
jgi:hypothetical protein